MKEIVNIDIEVNITINGKPVAEFNSFTKELSTLLSRFQTSANNEATNTDLDESDRKLNEDIPTQPKKEIKNISKNISNKKRTDAFKFVGVGDVFRKALKRRVGSLEEFAKKLGYKRKQSLYGAIVGDYALPKERWEVIFKTAGLTPVFFDNTVDIAGEAKKKEELTLTEVVKLAPLIIKDKVHQQYFIDKDIAYQMATTCKTTNECNNLLDKLFKAKQGVSSSLGVAMQGADE